MSTTLALMKTALGHDSDDGFMPRIVFEDPNLSGFIETVCDFWKSNCDVKKVINPQTICPLRHFVELCLALMKAYSMFQSFPLLQQLGKLQPGNGGFIPRYIPAYTPAKLRGVSNVPYINEILHMIYHALRPQVDTRSGCIILKRPPRLTIYTTGMYMDNRPSITRVLLGNGVEAGPIDQQCLRLGIPLRRNVLEYVNAKFCTGYPTTVIDSLECLSFAERTYFVARGAVADDFDPAIVGAYHDGADGQPRNVPWDPDYVPIQFRDSNWDQVNLPQDPNLPGCVLEVMPAEPWEIQSMTRPWMLRGTMYTKYQQIPRDDLLHCGSWPLFSDFASPLRTEHLEQIVPQEDPRPAVPAPGPPRLDYTNFPSNIIQKIPDLPGHSRVYSSTLIPMDKDRSKAELAMPQTVFNRPTQQDAIPPRNLMNQTQRMGRQGFIAGFDCTWAIFESLPVYYETERYELRDVTHDLARAAITTDIALNIETPQWPAIGTSDGKPSSKGAFNVRTQQSRRQALRRRRPRERNITDPPEEKKTADRPEPTYENGARRSVPQNGGGGNNSGRGGGRNRQRNRNREKKKKKKRKQSDVDETSDNVDPQT